MASEALRRRLSPPLARKFQRVISETPPCHTPAVGSEAEQELDDRWWLGLRMSVLRSVDIQEFTVVLRFGAGCALTIESAAYLRAVSTPGTETPAVIRNEDGTVSASDALRSLTGQRVLSSVGFKTGHLRLVFESGAQLTVPYDEHFEAWQLTGTLGTPMGFYSRRWPRDLPRVAVLTDRHQCNIGAVLAHGTVRRLAAADYRCRSCPRHRPPPCGGRL
jgi:hypothetical protein